MATALPILLWSLAYAVAFTSADSEAMHEVVTSPFVLPGGVADPAGRHGFLANAEGGVSAVDLRSGKVLWESSAARLPIFVTGERLFASVSVTVGTLQVVALDVTRKGEVVFRSDTITVPSAPAIGAQTVHWSVGKDQLRVTWDLSSESVARGGATVDLRTGHVQPLAEVLLGQALKPPPGLTKLMVRWEGVVGDAYKALALEETPLGQRFVFQAWSLTTGDALPPRELLQGKRLLVRATENNQYLCLRDAVPSPDQKVDEAGQHAWSVFDVGTGERIARLPFEPGTQAIAVLGPRAYYLVAGAVPLAVGRPFVNPRVLKAVDLKSGRTLWERPAAGKRVNAPGT
jgi:hypothetical protein